ncbi:centromere protein O-like isoform X4 [Syngnathoides biaculeatus]|uniref:centromere protein O-like isoform X4 n=1 Tax=Syngnathoides biaculeatus TaxID=300417 RepID=UPI002ADDBF59|nr:centromere protein O-like isoform X4 [Syngnathoides biaculeatus]
MEAAKGVLSQLSALEVRAKRRRVTSPSHADALRTRLDALTAQRERLKAEIHTLRDVEKRKMELNNRCPEEEEEAEDTMTGKLLHLMAKQTQLKELLRVHNITGGYNVAKTREGEGVCLTLATGYEGAYLDTYDLELDTRPALKIGRHNVPPFIPLGDLGERAGLQDDVRGFLDALGAHLNAFVGRREQLRLVKELHPSVTVMESNAPCTILVLMLSVPGENKTVLCTLNYTDRTRYLPTEVRFDCEDEKLPESPEWKNNRKLFMEMPVDRALRAMKDTTDQIG